MSRVLIRDAKQMIGKPVTLKAWVQTIRHQGRIAFVVLRDISGLVQGVAIDKDVVKAVDQLTLESVVEVQGEMKEAKQAPEGVEVKLARINVLSLAEPKLGIPVHEKAGDTNEDKRLDWRWLDLRKPHNQLIFKVWTEFEEAAREYWTKQDYLEIHSPKIISAASESGAEVFKIDYFEGVAFLAQSPQFYKQMAMAAGFEKVFEVGPVFRAEPSYTTRHATEFTGLDMEISFIDSHHDVIAEEERLLVQAIKAVKDRYGDDIKREFDRELVVPKTPFPKVTFAEAKQMLAKAKVAGSPTADFSPEEERQLSELVFKEHQHEFVFIVDYPTSLRPFYHMRHEDDDGLTKSFDLLWRGVEVTTGAQREHRYDVLTAQAKEKGLDLDELKFYLNFFRYGCPPHGGLGAGSSRIIMQLFGVPSIRDVTFVHRGVKRITP